MQEKKISKKRYTERISWSYSHVITCWNTHPRGCSCFSPHKWPACPFIRHPQISHSVFHESRPLWKNYGEIPSCHNSHVWCNDFSEVYISQKILSKHSKYSR